MVNVWEVPDDDYEVGWSFGNFWTDNIKQAHELQIIQDGPSHIWWTSARLLLGLSEDEARDMHHKLNRCEVWTIYNAPQDRPFNVRDEGKMSFEPVEKGLRIDYLEALVNG